MKNNFLLSFLLGIQIVIGCSEQDGYVVEKNITFEGNSSYRGRVSVGIENAIRKARQMTDIVFTPGNPIQYNNGTYQQGVSYKGVIYSSVKETETYVGECVSFHTFITAVNNPKSKLYTERVNQFPYHGVNCKAYYGTVCSGLVSYALGLVPRYASYDFPESDLIELVDYTSPENLQIADILWKEGHVALITDIFFDENNQVSTIEISESPSYNCKRYFVSRDHFLNVIMGQNFKKLYRYRDIDKNTSFISAPEIDVENEGYLAICVDKGDKSCYLEGESVNINILAEGFDSLEIFKDGMLFMAYSHIQGEDIVLKALTYGDYMARIIHNNQTNAIISKNTARPAEVINCETYWKVVNAEIKVDLDNSKLYFKSSNAKPLYAICCRENGTRPHLKSGFYHVFTTDEIGRGEIDVNWEKLDESYPYIKMFFETDYGTIINTPINWCE